MVRDVFISFKNVIVVVIINIVCNEFVLEFVL